MNKNSPYVYFDSNAGTNDDGYILWFDRSLRDLSALGSGAADGLLVTLYMPEEIEIQARLKFDVDLGFWRGIPI